MMFDGIILEWKLWKLHRQKDEISKKYKKIYDEAKKQNKDSHAMQLIFFDEMDEYDMIDDKIIKLHTRHLRDQAERYLIPVPPIDVEGDAWEESDIDLRPRLTRKGISDLKAKIRQEKRERREVWQSWLVLLTGLIGALIGLLSVL